MAAWAFLSLLQRLSETTMRQWIIKFKLLKKGETCPKSACLPALVSNPIIKSSQIITVMKMKIIVRNIIICFLKNSRAWIIRHWTAKRQDWKRWSMRKSCVSQRRSDLLEKTKNHLSSAWQAAYAPSSNSRKKIKSKVSKWKLSKEMQSVRRNRSSRWADH